MCWGLFTFSFGLVAKYLKCLLGAYSDVIDYFLSRQIKNYSLNQRLL